MFHKEDSKVKEPDKKLAAHKTGPMKTQHDGSIAKRTEEGRWIDMLGIM